MGWYQRCLQLLVGHFGECHPNCLEVMNKQSGVCFFLGGQRSKGSIPGTCDHNVGFEYISHGLGNKSLCGFWWDQPPLSNDNQNSCMTSQKLARLTGLCHSWCPIPMNFGQYCGMNTFKLQGIRRVVDWDCNPIHLLISKSHWIKWDVLPCKHAEQ